MLGPIKVNTTMTEQQQSTSHTPKNVPLWAVFIGLASSAALAFATVGVVYDWGGLRSGAVGFSAQYGQGAARLLPLPPTAEARAGCEALGGVNTWSAQGTAVFTPNGGYCSYMMPIGAMNLHGAHRGSTVEHHFPGGVDGMQR